MPRCQDTGPPTSPQGRPNPATHAGACARVRAWARARVRVRAAYGLVGQERKFAILGDVGLGRRHVESHAHTPLAVLEVVMACIGMALRSYGPI